MAAPVIWAKQSKATNMLMLADLMKMIINTESLFEIVEAYDADHASDKRRVPTAGSEGTLDNAAFASDGGFSWYNNQALGVDDWIVLESTNATGNKFQVLFVIDSATEIKHWLFPLDDFAVGGADVSPPVRPATSLGTTMGAASAGSGFTTLNASMSYSAVCDNESINLVCDDLTTPANVEWIHVGVYDDASPSDPYPFVIHTTPSYAYPRLSDDFIKIDVTLEKVSFRWASLSFYGTGSPSVISEYSGIDGLGGYWGLYPACAVSLVAVHGDVLNLRNVQLTHQDQDNSGTHDSLAFMYIGSDAASAKLTFPWDGSTVYP